jgi:hypothetical protein
MERKICLMKSSVVASLRRTLDLRLKVLERHEILFSKPSHRTFGQDSGQYSMHQVNVSYIGKGQ